MSASRTSAGAVSAPASVVLPVRRSFGSITWIVPWPEPVRPPRHTAPDVRTSTMSSRSFLTDSDEAGPGIPFDCSRPIGSPSRPSAVIRMVNVVPRGKNSCSYSAPSEAAPVVRSMPTPWRVAIGWSAGKETVWKVSALFLIGSDSLLRSPRSLADLPV